MPNFNNPGHQDTSSIIVAKILTPHGVKGLLKVSHYCDSTDEFMQLNPFSLEDGRVASLKVSGQVKNALICQMEGVTTREQADKLKSAKLYKNRSELPEPSGDVHYWHDLIGIDGFLADGSKFGVVAAVYNFGASDIIEIKLNGSDELKMFAFSKENFPEVDIAGRKLIIHPPEED